MSVPDTDAYQAIVRRGRPALAWEVLRRDPDYRRAYAAMGALPDPGIAAGPSFVAHWGLHFP